MTMTTLGRRLRVAAVAAALFAFISPSYSAVTLTISEVGPDVVATGSGSLNTTGMSPLSSAAVQGFVAGPLIDPDIKCDVLIGEGTGLDNQQYWTYEPAGGFVSEPASDCSIGTTYLTTTDTGDRFGVRRSDIVNVPDAIKVPRGYASGAPLSGSSTWEGQSIAGLGLVPGTYVYTWGDGENADTFTLVIEAGTPEVSIIADFDASEPASPGLFFVFSSEPAGTGGLTVNYTVDGSSTATAGVDYVALSGSVTIPEGSINADIEVSVIDDLLVEGIESVVVQLVDGPGYRVGTGSAPIAQVLIFDDDVPPPADPTVTISATMDGAEPSTNGQFQVTSSAAAGVGGITVNYAVSGASTATAGADYTVLSGSVVIAEATTSATIDVPVLDDTDVEATETVVVDLLDGADYDLGSPATATVNITSEDVDDPVVPPPPPRPSYPVPTLTDFGAGLAILLLLLMAHRRFRQLN